MKDYYWLNKNSERFLGQGYLEGDETGRSRVKDIGLAAEEYLGIKGFAEKFEKYMAMGFYSLSSP